MRTLLLLLLAAPLSAALSQRDDTLLHPGARLRWAAVDTVDRATGATQFAFREGRLDSLEGRSLVLRPSAMTGAHAIGQDTARVPMSGITSAEAFTGLHRHAVRGALAGLAVGALTGYLLGETGSSGGRQCAVVVDILMCGLTPGHPDTRVRRSASFGAAGVVAGAIVGYLIQTESWTQVDLAGLRLRLGVE
jgi:hypothetical protein